MTRFFRTIFFPFFLTAMTPAFAETLNVASYNLQNYTLEFRMIDGKREPNYPKPENEKTALRTTLCAIAPDILAVQEIGGDTFVNELQRDLKKDGCHFPYVATLDGPDGKRNLAIFSKKPFKEIHKFPYIPIKWKVKSDTPRYDGPISRGLLGVTIATENGDLTIFTVHLKSRLTTDKEDDPQATAQRNAEATAIRDKIREFLDNDTDANILLIGDFNDNPTSGALNRFQHIGQRNLLTMLTPRDARNEVWTYRNKRDGYYSRSDYLLVSPALEKKVTACHIVDFSIADNASDHRIILGKINLEKPK